MSLAHTIETPEGAFDEFRLYVPISPGALAAILGINDGDIHANQTTFYGMVAGARVIVAEQCDDETLMIRIAPECEGLRMLARRVSVRNVCPMANWIPQQEPIIRH